MECDTDLGQEYLQILSDEILFGSIPYLLKCLAARHTGLRVIASERQVVVPGLEIISLLLRKL